MVVCRSSVSASDVCTQVVLLGEYHDDPIAHHIQQELIRRCIDCHQLSEPQTASTPSSIPPAHPHDSPAGNLQGHYTCAHAFIVTPAPMPPLLNLHPCLHHLTRTRAFIMTPAPMPDTGAGSEVLPPENACSKRPCVSLEMFERDVQAVMDEYLQGVIREGDFIKDSRPWPNYVSDYHPAVQMAKQAKLPVICANAPRRCTACDRVTGMWDCKPGVGPGYMYVYSSCHFSACRTCTSKYVAHGWWCRYVSLVGRQGRQALDTLPRASWSWIAPLPYAQASEMYMRKVNETMGRGALDLALQSTNTPGESSGGGCPYIGFSVSSNFLDAQTLWDATMGHSIAQVVPTLLSTSSF